MIIAYIDGGARGNPGIAGCGVRVEDASGQVLAEISEPIGIATNNVAEYRALLAALAWAVSHDAEALHVRSDSLLLVKQMRGEYKVRHPNLRSLHRQALGQIARIGRVVFEHVPRARNKEADRLANLAMDESKGHKVSDAGLKTERG